MNASSFIQAVPCVAMFECAVVLLTRGVVVGAVGLCVGCPSSTMTAAVEKGSLADVDPHQGSVATSEPPTEDCLVSEHDKNSDSAREASVAGVLKRLGAHYCGLPGFAVRSEIEMEVIGAPKPSKILNNRTITIGRPNKFAFSGENRTQFAVRSDGEIMTTFLPVINQYTRAPCLPSIEEVLHTPLGSVPGGSLGSFALHLAASDPKGALMEDVVETSYAGIEEIQGTAAHRLEFLQTQRDGDVEVPIHWTLWTDITERPLLLQVQIVTEAPDRSPVGGKKIKLIVTERFLDWDLAPELGEETFRFKPPEGAKEVKVLFEGMSQSGNLRSENAAP